MKEKMKKIIVIALATIAIAATALIAVPALAKNSPAQTPSVVQTPVVAVQSAPVAVQSPPVVTQPALSAATSSLYTGYGAAFCGGKLSARVVDSFKAVAATRGIGIRLSITSKIDPVSADADRTAQVLRNLIDNALKYSPDGSSVEVKVISEKGNVTVSVADHGRGISAENLPLVFERFYRVDRSRSRSTGGSGLGLAIAKQLVEAQGGSIRAESKVGGGSTFSFSLPASR
jgi:two-component sensor histidine kinase